MTPAQIICFYDETLKKQKDGFYGYDGKAIHVGSMVYGARSAPVRLTCFADHNAVDLFAKEVLSELARDSEKNSATSHSLKKAA